MKFAVVHASRGDFPVATLCKVFGVSRSGYYDFVGRMKRPPTERERAARRLDHEIRVAFDEGRGAYGRPRILRALRNKGVRVGENRIRGRMAAMRLQAKPRRRFVKTTLSDHDQKVAPNLVRQNFSADAADRVWCSDITYVRTWQGWVYVAVVIDLFSRKVVGWAAAEHMRSKLVTDAMTMAIGRRSVQPGLIFHSDRGSQYASKAVRHILRRNEMQRSMSAKGNCYTATTTPWSRASMTSSSRNSSTATFGRPELEPSSRSLTTLNASTTPSACTPALDAWLPLTPHPTTTKTNTRSEKPPPN